MTDVVTPSAEASESPGAGSFLPSVGSLPALAKAAAGCRGCSLWSRATQTVFGVGDLRAPLMLVGEQPGDREDRDGVPFVGPAGRVLDDALEQAAIPRQAIYLTNAVKHFKWEPRGKRRLHQRPSAAEVRACRPWLSAEIDAVHPNLILCLGAVAAESLLGPAVRVTRDRGQTFSDDRHRAIMVTIHPSAILRAREASARKREMDAFVADLSGAAHAARLLTA